MNTEGREAGFWVRLAAYALDWLLLSAVLLFVRIPAFIYTLGGGLSGPVLFTFSWVDILCFAVTAAYFTLMTAFTGSTLGKKAMRLRVVTVEGKKLGFLMSLYRETVGRYLSGILCIGYIVLLADSRKQALHDKICDTLVIYDNSVPAREKAPAPRSWERPREIVPVEDPVKDWYTPYRM